MNLDQMVRIGLLLGSSITPNCSFFSIICSLKANNVKVAINYACTRSDP